MLKRVILSLAVVLLSTLAMGKGHLVGPAKFRVEIKATEKNHGVLTQSMMPRNSGKNTIYVIKDAMTIKDNIIVPEECELEFDGGSLNGGNVTILSNTKVSKGFFNNCILNIGNNSESVEIRDCVFNNYENKTNAISYSIFCHGCRNLIIANNTFSLGLKQGGINLRHAVDASVSDNIITGVDVDITAVYKYITCGITVAYVSTGTLIKGNVISNMGIGVNIDGQGERNTEFFQITDNNIHDCYCYGICIYGNTASKVSHGIISGNVIRHITGTYASDGVSTEKNKQQAMGGGIYVNLVDNFVVSNNYINNTAEYNNNSSTLAPAGIAFSASSNNVCSNNHISNAFRQSIIVAGDNNNVTGNIIQDGLDNGIELRFGNNCLINGNIVKHVHNTGIKLSFYSPARDLVLSHPIISNNSITEANEGIFVANYTEDVNINNNTIKTTRFGMDIRCDNDINVSFNRIESDVCIRFGGSGKGLVVCRKNTLKAENKEIVISGTPNLTTLDNYDLSPANKVFTVANVKYIVNTVFDLNATGFSFPENSSIQVESGGFVNTNNRASTIDLNNATIIGTFETLIHRSNQKTINFRGIKVGTHKYDMVNKKRLYFNGKDWVDMANDVEQ